jgi:hypothetical protein
VPERRSALAALLARHPALLVRHPVLPGRHPAPPAWQPMADCPGVVRYAPEVAACQLPPVLAGVKV